MCQALIHRKLPILISSDKAELGTFAQNLEDVMDVLSLAFQSVELENDSDVIQAYAKFCMFYSFKIC